MLDPLHQSQVCLFGVKKLNFIRWTNLKVGSSITVCKMDVIATTMLQSSTKLDINNTEQVVSFSICGLYPERIGSQKL